MWYNLYYNLRTTLLGTTLFQFTTANTTKNPPLTNHEKRKKEICLNYHTDIPLFFYVIQCRIVSL